MRKKILLNKNAMLISCFGGENMENFIYSNIDRDVKINYESVKYLSKVFSNHHGLLLQELKKLQVVSKNINLDLVLKNVIIPYNAQYYKIACYFFNKNKLLFWQELESMRNKNIDDLVVLRYLMSFTLDLFNYHKSKVLPGNPQFFMYKDNFIAIGNKYDRANLHRVLNVLIEMEVGIQDLNSLFDDIVNLI